MNRRLLLIPVLLAGAAYLRARPALNRSGAGDEDVAREMPGDDWVPRPAWTANHAIHIDAAPGDIYPWLVQMGKGRGGLYSFDRLDRAFGFLDERSAERILPEYQDLKPGDVIPMGSGEGFPVYSMERDRSLILAGEQDGVRWTWQFGLYDDPKGGTRLVSRNRASGPGRLRSAVTISVIELPALIMTRQMLRNLKRRAERLARERERVADARKGAARYT